MPFLRSQIEVFTKNSPNKKVTSLTTEVSLIQGQLSTLMNETITDIQGDVTTISTNYTTFKQDYDSFTTEASKSITQLGKDVDTTSTTANQTAEQFKWIVKSGTSETDFMLTDRAISLVSDTIDLSGYVTFNSLSSQGSTAINGSNITTGTIAANRLDIAGIFTTNASVKNQLLLDGGYLTTSASRTYYNQGVAGITLDKNGIGGWTSSSEYWNLSKGKLTASNATLTNANVSGAITATSGSFTGTISSSNATITGGSLKVGSNFSVNSSGTLTASNANISGTVNATSGSFAGTISSGGLSGSGTGWIYPDSAVLTLIKNHVTGIATMSSHCIKNSDLNMNNTIDAFDYSYAKALMWGAKTIEQISSSTGYVAENSTINFEINPNDTRKTIRIWGNNSWDLLRETYLSVNGLSTSTVECDYIISNGGINNYGNATFNGEINSTATYNNSLTCNVPAYFNRTVYNSSGGTVFTSDENAKHDIQSLDIEESAEFIYSLDAVEYKFNDGDSNRLHHGLIAPDVKEAMGNRDWGLYTDQRYSMENPTLDDDGNVLDEDGNIIPTKGLRYEELIADLIATIQSQNKRIKYLEIFLNKDA